MKNVTVPNALVSVGVVVIILMASLFALVSISSDNATAEVERDAKAELLSRLSALASRPETATAKRGASLAIIAGSETLAAAAFDRVLRDAIVQTGGTVIETRAEAVRDGERDTRAQLLLHAVIEGHINELQALLFTLETGFPRASIDELVITPTQNTSRAPGDEMLRASLQASATWRAVP